MVPDGDDQHRQAILLNAVDRPVITGSNAIKIFRAHELDVASGTRISSQFHDPDVQPPQVRFR
jgi:hypothetical protein